MLLAFGMVISGNLIWNVAHQFTTLSHTVDNVGWVRQDNLPRRTELCQRGRVSGQPVRRCGPGDLCRRAGRDPQAACASGLCGIPPLAVVTVQALLGTAQANWAVAAYFAGIPLAMGLPQERPRWLTASFMINAVFCTVLPLLTIFTALQWCCAPLIELQLSQAQR